ncbi:MAG: Ig-like domain-containing protein [Candidatus Margulisiibacteriota bacterium]|jgi:hypothetical protein
MKKNRSPLVLLVLFAFFGASSVLAAGGSHVISGKALPQGTNYSPAAYKVWMSDNSSQTQSGNCGYSATNYTYFQDNLADPGFNSSWTNGQIVIGIIEKANAAESGAGLFSASSVTLSDATATQNFSPDFPALANVPQPTATVNSAQGRVDLAWTAASAPAGTVAGYNVYRSADGTTFTKINDALVSGTTYSDTAANSTPDPVVGAVYYYAIKIVFTANVESAYRSLRSAAQVTYPGGGSPAISLNKPTISLVIAQGENAAAQTFTIGNTGTAALNYTVADNQTWLDINPKTGSVAQGAAAQTITVSFTTAGLAASATPYSATITVTDPNATNNPQTIAVSLTVNASGGTNHAPTANDVTVSTASNTAVAVNFSATDADGNLLTYSLVSSPTQGSLGTISGNQVTYTPAASYVGTDSFTYRAHDGIAYSNVGTVNITVTNGTPGPGPEPTPSGTAPIINNIYRSGASSTDPDRAKGPAGVRIILEGTNFRDSLTSSSRAVEFTSLTTSALTEGIILNWTTTSIEVVLPAGLPSGMYGVDVKVSAPSASDPAVVTTFVSTPKDFLVTASAAGDVAQVYPNPFNPLAEQANIVVSNTGGASRLGYYIYDMAAQLVYRTSTGASQITWNGVDQWGSLVSDGAYILRVVNEDNKSLLAKGKILVVKR